MVAALVVKLLEPLERLQQHVAIRSRFHPGGVEGVARVYAVLDVGGCRQQQRVEVVAAVDKRLWELEHDVRAARERRVGVDGDAVVAEQRVDIGAQMEAVAEVHGHGEIDGARGLADQSLAASTHDARARWTATGWTSTPMTWC